MVTPRATDVTALSVTQARFQAHITAGTHRQLGGHAQRAARTAVRIRRDSSGMLRSVRASGAWTGSRDAIHDM